MASGDTGPQLSLGPRSSDRPQSSDSSSSTDRGTDDELPYVQGTNGEFERRVSNSWKRTRSANAAEDFVASGDDDYRFEIWYPTPKIFKWRYTVAYWVAIMFVQGSFLITFSAALTLLERWVPHLARFPKTLVDIPNALGIFFFLLGSYAGYSQLINLPTTDKERVTLLFPDWKKVRIGVGLESCVGTIAYLIGMMCFACGFYIGLYFSLYDIKMSQTFTVLVIKVPYIVGGLGFLVGGICELLHNRIFRGGATHRETVWWASIANTLGGLCYTLGTASAFVEPWRSGESLEVAVKILYCIANIIYIFSSICMIVMWQANDLGLTLLRQLTLAARDGEALEAVPAAPCPHGKQRLRVHVRSGSSRSDKKLKFSLRGAMFIIIYCWFAVAVLLDLVIRRFVFEDGADDKFRKMNDGIMQSMLLGGVFLILIVHSVIISVPNEQPYRFAVIAGRALFLAGTLAQTVVIFEFLATPDKSLTTHETRVLPGGAERRPSLAFLAAVAVKLAGATKKGCSGAMLRRRMALL